MLKRFLQLSVGLLFLGIILAVVVLIVSDYEHEMNTLPNQETPYTEQGTEGVLPEDKQEEGRYPAQSPE